MIRDEINENLPTHSKIIDICSQIIPKNSNTVVFGSMNGEYYGDNSMHLFEWILEHRSDLNPVWLTRSEDVVRQLEAEGKPVESVYSLAGIKSLFRSKVGVFTNSLYDLAVHPFIIPKTLKLIALRHGRSVKRIRFARKNHKISDRERKQRKKEAELIEYAISTSDFISDLQEECLQIGREKHVVTGYPRNKELISPSENREKNWIDFFDASIPSNVILYAPTWRHGREPVNFFPFDNFDLHKLSELLDKNDAKLLIRPHANDLQLYPSVEKQISELATDCPHIELATHDKFSDVNSILPFVDVLITDYSAIYHDFLLLDKPILFIPYDYESFKEKNGFLYDYNKHLPGPKIDSFNSFTIHLENILSDVDEYTDNRANLRDKVHKYKDGKANERIITIIEDLSKSH